MLYSERTGHFNTLLKSIAFQGVFFPVMSSAVKHAALLSLKMSVREVFPTTGFV